MPFANTSKGEYGTYFIGYASTFTTTRQMLESMFIGNPVGNTDRLLDFSTAVTGTLFFSYPPTIYWVNWANKKIKDWRSITLQ